MELLTKSPLAIIGVAIRKKGGKQYILFAVSRSHEAGGLRDKLFCINELAQA